MALFINKSTTKKTSLECVSISNYKSSPACRAAKWDEHSSNLRGWYWRCCCYFFMKHVLLISINSNLKNCCGNSHQFSFHSLRDMNQFQLRSSRRLIDSLGVMNLWWTNALQKPDTTKGETANATVMQSRRNLDRNIWEDRNRIVNEKDANENIKCVEASDLNVKTSARECR